MFFSMEDTHMIVNWWFRSKQRMYEAVVYDFLLKYYKSMEAREKTAMSFIYIEDSLLYCATKSAGNMPISCIKAR